MSVPCTHVPIDLSPPDPLTPDGCTSCVAEGRSDWVHLRECQSCGHVGCCDDSPNRHATAHFRATGHPIIEGYDPPEGWGWCYVDDDFIELPDQTPQLGPIPRYF